MACRPVLRPLLPVLAGLCLLLTGCSTAPRLVSGELHGEQTWRGVVHVGGDVEVAADALLRIEPGTEVRFLPAAGALDRLREHPHFRGSELIVRGRILAQGTAARPIAFRYLDPGAPAGSWGGINLMESPEALFSHCLFTQADSALHSQGSTVAVRESVFTANLVGVRFHSSDIRIEKNLFFDNGAAVRFHYGAPVIRGNTFRGNLKTFFLTSYPRNYRIEGNNILDSSVYSVVLGEEVPDDVRMSGNFWGRIDPATIEAGFFDGRREEHLGHVRYRPFARTPFPDSGISWAP